MPAGGTLLINPFSNLTGAGVAWEDRASFAANPNATSGLVSYADSNTATYNIKGVGKATTGTSFPLPLMLSAGQ